MHLAKIAIENFRIFGSKTENKHLDLTLSSGLTVLVGENDSGKTAIADALRLVLGTTSQDYLRVTDDDFHRTNGTIAPELTIYCRFEELTENEAGRFLEWLTLEDKKPALELTLRAFRTVRKSRSGSDVPIVEFFHRTGANGEGKQLEGEIRSFLRMTYLKPLRDAEAEMSAGKGSRLSQLLLHHPHLKNQDKNSELPAAETGKPIQPPQTLRGIMATAEKWIRESPAILEAKKQLNTDYLSNLSVGFEKLTGEITIGRTTDLRGILEKLELWLTPGGGAIERTRHGLGMNNLLFMAAELLLLSESAETGLPLLLIEEPEAHLHPQLQLRLMEFLETKNEGVSPVQVIVSTHSPNLSSKANIENLTILAQGKAYPLSRKHTELTPGDYRYLRKFLEVTKANLFFARGIVIVEGDAEDILLPTLAKLLGRSFTEFGVSMINVGSTGLFRYARIFQRKDTKEQNIRVACVSDRDIPPDEAKSYVPKSGTEPKFESEILQAQKLESHLESLKRYDGGVVKTFISEKWTLEYDLALHGLASEVHQAISLAKKFKNSDREFDEAECNKILDGAEKEFCELVTKLSKAELAAHIYQPLFDNKASKPETAQILSEILERRKLQPDQLLKKLPPYLVSAIEYVTESIPKPQIHAKSL